MDKLRGIIEQAWNNRELLQEAEIRQDINNLNLEKQKRDVLNKLSVSYEKYNSKIVKSKI